MLIFMLRIGESKQVDHDTIVTVLGIKGNYARLGIGEIVEGQTDEGTWPEESDNGKPVND